VIAKKIEPSIAKITNAGIEAIAVLTINTTIDIKVCS
jgi:hypothetical protein